jgi:chromosome segregation ATPase
MKSQTERKLHPNLLLDTDFKKGSKGQIQTEFDPTPVMWLQSDIAQVKSAVKEITEQQEFLGEVKIKMNRLAQKVQNIEERLDAVSTEMRGSYAKLASRLAEKAITESRVESFMEKHNQVLQNFERKMGQMTRLLEDYQNKIMISNAALDDARREISRLKKL